MEIMESEELNALALEYQADYGTAWGNLDIADIMNNPNAGGVSRVFGPGFEEEISNLLGVQVRTFLNDGPDAFMVRGDSIKTLPE